MILEVKEIHTFYGPSHVLFGISLKLHPQEVLCLLGRNGAGKTTTIRSIMGLTPPKSGKIFFKGEAISCFSPHLIAKKGIGYVASGGELFGDLTVRENLLVAMKKPFQEVTDPWTLDRVYNLFPILKERVRQKANSLSGGERMMLAIARTLMGNPEVLLLDEPTTGLSPIVIDGLAQYIRNLRDEGLSILLAEQNVKFALALGKRCQILENGAVRFEGPTSEVLKDKDLARTYLAV